MPAELRADVNINLDEAENRATTQAAENRALSGLDALEDIAPPASPAWQRWAKAAYPPILAVVIIIAVWQLAYAADFKTEDVLPSPMDAWHALMDFSHQGVLWPSVGGSLLYGAIGFVIAAAIGTPLGLILGRVRPIRAGLGPIVTGLQNLPSVAWVPIAIIWFHLTPGAKYFVVIMGAFPSIANGMVNGLDQVPPIFLKVGHVLGAQGFTLARRVLLPAVMPAYIGGLRQGWAFAWRSLMAAEIIAASLGHGLGALLSQAQDDSSIAQGARRDHHDPRRRHRGRGRGVPTTGTPRAAPPRPRRRRSLAAFPRKALASLGVTRLLLLGSGELGKEVAIEAARLGVEVVAADRYAGAPAMQVTPHARVLDMLDGAALRALVEEVQPDLIVPEVEAIATDTLLELEAEGWHVVPTARATRLTMDREGIRRLAAEELGLPTSPYRFASDEEAFTAAVEALGTPCVVKPVMSSSGKGQSGGSARGRTRSSPGGTPASTAASTAGRSSSRASWTSPTRSPCSPSGTPAGRRAARRSGHLQVDGDYREVVAAAADEPGGPGRGPPGSPRPSPRASAGTGCSASSCSSPPTTGCCSARSARGRTTPAWSPSSASRRASSRCTSGRSSGLPVGGRRRAGPGRASASAAVRADTALDHPTVTGLETALAVPTAQVRVFGKPSATPGRRMAVALARGEDLEQARSRARAAAAALQVT